MPSPVPSSSTRRSLLASGLAFLAGCVSGVDAGDAPTETVDTSTEATPTTVTTTRSTPTPSGSPPVSFAGYAVQRSAFYRRHPDFEVVWVPPDRQLVFATVAVEGGRPTDLSVEDFTLRIDDRTVAGADAVEGKDGGTYSPYPDECECETEYDTYATFPLRAPTSASTAEVRWDGPEETRTWSLPDEAMGTLGSPTTEWERVSFDAPESVGPDESFSVAMAARNVGGAAGTFRGVLNQEGPMYGVSAKWKRDVPAGATIRREDRIDDVRRIESDVSAVRLRLRSVAGDVDHEVRVE
ncbi:MAG: hypothetical protein ACI9YT_000343 [Halobacteriales archaeon]|jgi:hypothetical protein